MRALVQLAFANLAARPARTGFVVILLLSGFLCQSLVRASYADLFKNLEREQREIEGDIYMDLPETGGPTVGQWSNIRTFFLEDSRVESIIARAPLNGLIGREEGSSPVSGLAIEDSQKAPGENKSPAYKVKLGLSLAQGLSLEAGDMCTGLLNNRLHDLILAETTTTEVLFKDRFWIEVFLAMLQESAHNDGDTPLLSIAFRLRAGTLSSFEETLASIGEQDTVKHPGIALLAGSTLFSLKKGNTRANTIMSVYEDNYRMIAVTVLLVVFLALVNVLLLSCRERGNELGTLHALGARKSDIALLMWAESILLSLFACILGIILDISLSSLANATGGIKLPPPPASTEPMILRFLVHPKDIAGTTLSLLTASLCAPLIPLQWLARKETAQLLHSSQ